MIIIMIIIMIMMIMIIIMIIIIMTMLCYLLYNLLVIYGRTARGKCFIPALFAHGELDLFIKRAVSQPVVLSGNCSSRSFASNNIKYIVI